MHERLGPTRFRFVIAATAFCIGTFSAVSYSTITGWQKAIAVANEQALDHNLSTLRNALRKYAEDKQELPHSFDDLINAGYVGVLKDPVTGQANWGVVVGEDPSLVKGRRGIINIHSASTKISSRGTRYNAW